MSFRRPRRGRAGLSEFDFVVDERFACRRFPDFRNRQQGFTHHVRNNSDVFGLGGHFYFQTHPVFFPEHFGLVVHDAGYGEYRTHDLVKKVRLPRRRDRPSEVFCLRSHGSKNFGDSVRYLRSRFVFCPPGTKVPAQPLVWQCFGASYQFFFVPASAPESVLVSTPRFMAAKFQSIKLSTTAAT